MKLNKEYRIDLIFVHILFLERDNMKKNNKEKNSEELLHSQEQKKTEGNNQWTNNNLKYYPDKRERQDGPGGN